MLSTRIMAIIGKKVVVEQDELTVKEYEFILKKLRTADFKGGEFEQFYVVLKKLNNYIVNLS